MSKRVVDVLFALIGIVVLLPLFFIISVWIMIDSPEPVFFRQIRIGQFGHEFEIYKFRTMVVDAEKLGKQITVDNDPRITRSGRFLRKFKLDELPQLLNVLKGDMSLVGPRPEVPKYVEMYTPEQRRVLEVRPGITDPASIEFRNESELLVNVPDPEMTYVQEIMPRKLKLNLQYIAQPNLISDFRIILHTLARIMELVQPD